MELRQSAALPYFIRAVRPGEITVGETPYTGSVIVMNGKSHEAWGVTTFDAISLADLSKLAAYQPELIVFGTGAQQHFLTPEQQAVFIEARIPVETMNTHAACRTFNILVEDERPALGAFIHV